MAGPLNIADFLSTHFPTFYPDQFDNECTTQSKIHLEPDLPKKFIDWIKTFKPDTSHKSVLSSNNYREHGNRLFRSNKSLNAQEASHYYTNAILAAPNDGSKSLALAHANRSAALAEFGYFKEAYEDCQCAMDYGYPDENLEKIIIRQANCANKLNDYDKLKICLIKLREMALSAPFAKQKAGLEKDLIRLQEENGVDEKPERKAESKIQNIMTHPRNGRYMTASKDIGTGEEVLIEKAFSLVPIAGAKICSYCAAQKIIPFPCNVCSTVYYCSLKCRRDGEMVHRFECYAQRCGLLKAIGITHLAMNTLLNGLPSIVPSLRECTSLMGIWRKIEAIAKSGEKGYPEVLSLITNLDLMKPHEVHSYSLGAVGIAYYLKEFTAFFTLFDGCTCGSFEWTVIVSALALRHSAQMIANASSSCVLTCDVKPSDFQALSDIWAKPHHLKKGMLHKYSRFSVNFAGIYPYLSICNHSCVPSLSSRFDGDRVIACARHSLKKGAEICNTYLPDYRHDPKSVRQAKLKSIYHFDCNCKSCSSNIGDAEYLKFHTYRCQSSSCQTAFIPPADSLLWWNKSQPNQFLICPVCKLKFNLDWYWRFMKLSENPNYVREALQIVWFSREFLVGPSWIGRCMASIVVQLFFEARKRKLPIARDEIKEIGEVINYWLDSIEQQSDVESLTFVGVSTYALDQMALKQCFAFDCKKIHKSFKILPHDLRIVFENYIHDFIGDRFKY